jgi:hypothetical protein
VTSGTHVQAVDILQLGDWKVVVHLGVTDPMAVMEQLDAAKSE